jgi:hypothetical protein
MTRFRKSLRKFPLLSEFGNDITLNADLFAKVKATNKRKLESQSRKATLLDKKCSQETVPICENKKNYSSRNRQRTIEDES